MSETLQARIEAIRLAMQLEGSLKFKVKAAEDIYEFLEKGVVNYPNYNYGISYTGTISSDNLTVTNNE